MMHPLCNCGHRKTLHASGTSFCKNQQCSCSKYSIEVPTTESVMDKATPMVRTIHPMDALPREPDIPIEATIEKPKDPPTTKMIREDLLQDNKIDDIHEMVEDNSKSYNKKRTWKKKAAWYSGKD